MFEARITIEPDNANASIEIGSRYGLHYTLLTGYDEYGAPRNSVLYGVGDNQNDVMVVAMDCAADLAKNEIEVRRVQISERVYDSSTAGELSEPSIEASLSNHIEAE